EKIEELSRLVSELGAHRAASVTPAPAPVSPTAAAVHETTDKLETEPEAAAAKVAPSEPAKAASEVGNKPRPAKPKTATKAKASSKPASDPGSDKKSQPGDAGA